GGNEIQESLHIPLLCPTNKADWIILPPFLIVRIIAARAVGARHRERNLFLVHVGSGHVHADIANNGNAASIPQQSCRQLQWISRFRSRGDQRRIYAVAGEGSDRSFEVWIVGAKPEVRAKGFCLGSTVTGK